MSTIRNYETPVNIEEQPEFFLLNFNHWLWPWLVSGFVFLIAIVLLTGYING